MIEKTLAIIKPDAIKKKFSGKIIDRIEQENFNIIGLKKLHLTEEQAEEKPLHAQNLRIFGKNLLTLLNSKYEYLKVTFEIEN